MTEQLSTQLAAETPIAPPGKTGRLPWWATGGFGRLFLGHTVSVVGSQVTFMALPLIAVLTLHATPGAMGLLGAVDNLPYLLIGLWVGVFVDRHARRRLMILSDILRAIAVVSIPIAAIGGRLTFAQLCTVAFIVGFGNIVFDVACQAQLPELVRRERLVAANGAMQMSDSIAGVGAPGVVGILVKLIGAPLAILIDAVSYIVSAVMIGSIREPEEARPSEEGSTWAQIVDGLKLVRDDSRLVGIAGGAAMLSLAMNAAFAVLMYYLANRLGMDAGVIGLVFLAFGVGGTIGAVTVSPIAARLGAGRVLICSPLIGGAGLAGFAAAAESGLPFAGVLTAIFIASVVMGAGLVGFSVLASGVRQLLAPSQARGRVLGTLRFLEWGSMPLGSVIGGVVGEIFGAVPAILTSAVLLAGAAIWIVATPLRQLRELPAGD